MKAGDHIQPHRCGFAQRRDPVVGNATADGRRTNHQTARTRGLGFSQRIVGNARIHAAAWQRHLADTVGRAPLGEPQTGLGKSGIFGVAEKNHERRFEMNDIFHFGNLPRVATLIKYEMPPGFRYWLKRGRIVCRYRKTKHMGVSA